MDDVDAENNVSANPHGTELASPDNPNWNAGAGNFIEENTPGVNAFQRTAPTGTGFDTETVGANVFDGYIDTEDFDGQYMSEYGIPDFGQYYYTEDAFVPYPDTFGSSDFGQYDHMGNPYVQYLDTSEVVASGSNSSGFNPGAQWLPNMNQNEGGIADAEMGVGDGSNVSQELDPMRFPSVDAAIDAFRDDAKLCFASSEKGQEAGGLNAFTNGEWSESFNQSFARSLYARWPVAAKQFHQWIKQPGNALQPSQGPAIDNVFILAGLRSLPHWRDRVNAFAATKPVSSAKDIPNFLNKYFSFLTTGTTPINSYRKTTVDPCQQPVYDAYRFNLVGNAQNVSASEDLYLRCAKHFLNFLSKGVKDAQSGAFVCYPSQSTRHGEIITDPRDLHQYYPDCFKSIVEVFKQANPTWSAHSRNVIAWAKNHGHISTAIVNSRICLTDPSHNNWIARFSETQSTAHRSTQSRHRAAARCFLKELEEHNAKDQDNNLIRDSHGHPINCLDTLIREGHLDLAVAGFAKRHNTSRLDIFVKFVKRSSVSAPAFGNA
jgi:hypothetical protein